MNAQLVAVVAAILYARFARTSTDYKNGRYEPDDGRLQYTFSDAIAEAKQLIRLAHEDEHGEKE